MAAGVLWFSAASLLLPLAFTPAISRAGERHSHRPSPWLGLFIDPQRSDSVDYLGMLHRVEDIFMPKWSLQALA